MKDIRRPIEPNSTRLMGRLRIHIGSNNLAFTTEKSYQYWVLRFIRYHKKRHPDSMGRRRLKAF